ncbi:MAG: VPLPA-CTERM sorting domain-containing protein [Pseudomonadota bacterium]
MKKLFIAIAVAAASMTAATVSQALTYTFELADHPNGGLSGTYDYGLRLDREAPNPRFFSFGNGASATLVYNSNDGTAIMSGTLRESTGNGNFGGLYEFEYLLENLTDLGGGGFVDTSGSGTGAVFDAGLGAVADLALGAAAKDRDPYSGEYFRFGLDALLDRAFSGYEGTGWVQKMPGANDFLFTATHVSTMPLPAAAWMLLAALGGMGVIGRRRKAA